MSYVRGVGIVANWLCELMQEHELRMVVVMIPELRCLNVTNAGLLGRDVAGGTQLQWWLSVVRSGDNLKMKARVSNGRDECLR